MNFDLDHLAPPRDRQHVSIGGLCEMLQCLPGQIGKLMAAADVRFSMCLDGVPYLQVTDAERVAQKCRDVREEIASVAESAERN